MTGEQTDGFNLDEDDRLPWLEPAGEEMEAQGVPLAKVLLLVLLGLVLLAVIVGGGYWLKSGNAGDGGDARLIAAESGPYKEPANEADARTFDGEGDAAFEASEGGEAIGRIDASQVPEAPRTDLKPAVVQTTEAPKPAAAAKPTVAAPVKATAEPARKPAAAAAAVASEASSEGPRIQLGAFGSRALAEDVWKKMSGRFDYLAPLSHHVEPVETGGRTLYRLRVAVASSAAAGETCGKLRVAGESCMVVR